jgi:hypothetical protein
MSHDIKLQETRTMSNTNQEPEWHTVHNKHTGMPTAINHLKSNPYMTNTTETSKINEENSSWYLGILSRQRNSNQRATGTTSHKQQNQRNNSTAAPLETRAHFEIENKKSSYFTPNSIQPTTSPTQTHTKTQTKEFTSTSVNRDTPTPPQRDNTFPQNKNNTLTKSPFIQPKTSTMTVDTVTTDTNKMNHQKTAATSATLLAIAKTISEKIATSKTNTTRTSAMPTKTLPNAQESMLKLPKLVPPAPVYPTPTQATTICIPLMIRMTQTTTIHGKFDKVRILTAILHALQQNDPACNISPRIQRINDNTNFQKNLHTADDILQTQTIDKYLDIPTETTTGHFRARILLNTNADLHILKRSATLIAWLKSENITIDRNPLENSLKPQQIGFFTHYIVRADKTSMYEERISSSISDNCPPFFLQTKHLHASQAKTRVWNVYGDPAHVDIIIEKLKAAYNTGTFRQFFPWREYNSLQQAQQLTIIQMNNQFNTDFRSLMIPGFNTNDNNNVKMWDDDKPIEPVLDDEGEPTGKWAFTNQHEDDDMQEDDITDRFHNDFNLTTINITDFIQQNFISGDTTPIFAHVYDPINGTREVLVPLKHVPEAFDLIKTLKVELCRVMNLKSIQQSFDDGDDIIRQANISTPWTPFDIQTSIPAAHNTSIQYKPPQQPRKKRTKGFYHSETSSNKSYYEVASHNHNFYEHNRDQITVSSDTINSTITNPSQITEINLNNTGKSTDQLLATITNLQQDMKHLQDTITFIDQKIDQTSNEQSHDFRVSVEKCNQRIDDLKNDTSQSIQTLTSTFVEQMQLSQNSTNSLLINLLEKREVSLLEKMNDQIMLALSQSDGSTRSPTRKRCSATTSIENNSPSEMDTTMENQTQTVTLRASTIKNPYMKDTQTHRNAECALPVITN